MMLTHAGGKGILAAFSKIMIKHIVDVKSESEAAACVWRVSVDSHFLVFGLPESAGRGQA